jgi:PPK2 family polyphosphate:nucleotide phosphotransferase
MADAPVTAADIDPDQYRVRPGHTVRLRDWSTDTTDGFDGNKSQAQEVLTGLNERLADLQQMLYAESKHKVLIVLQGMDTSGKDGTIKHVFRTINPVGVKVADFKKPNDVELAHDYLWRVHEHTPRNGRMVIFNRSHYEDVLVVRVHDLVPETVWSRRYEHIRGFEQMLADEGTMVVKLFLHISKAEQKERLQERLDNPAKNWKFEHGDLSERAHWDAYTEAFEQALTETSTVDAPWYVIPSDRKWYRNLVVSELLIEKLEALGMTYPEPMPGLEDIRLED